MDEKPKMQAQIALPQHPGQIAIVAGIFVVLAFLLGHFDPGSFAGFIGLALTFLLYLLPTIVAVLELKAHRPPKAGH